MKNLKILFIAIAVAAILYLGTGLILIAIQ
jgi:hypothetical protein